MLPKITVVMSNYNGVTLGLLPDSLGAILSNNYPNLEVILVDNDSTDSSVSLVKRKFGKHSNFKLIQNPVNMYSQGLNLGIRNATGEYVAFFNNDARVKDGYFQRFIAYLEAHPRIALAQGKLLSAKDESIIDCVGEVIDLYGNPTSIGHGAKDTGQYEKIFKILSVTGSCSVVRKSLIGDIGFFDDEYGIGYEDLDLSLRAWMRGYEVVYFPDVQVFHQRGATDLAPMVRLKVRWHFNKNRIATVIKNYPSRLLFKSLFGIFIIYLLTGIFEIFIKRQPKLGMLRFTAIGWNIIHLPQLLIKRRLVQRRMKKNTFKKIEQYMMRRSLLGGIFVFLKGK
jgi:GT2 family glycosyltransferase